MRSRGFSLLEALVTLVIVALVMALLMQSLVHVLGMRERVLRHEREARVEAVHERWFRDSIAAALADRPDAVAPFRGDTATLELLSADALATGALASIRWRLAPEGRGVVLEYTEAGRQWALAEAGIEDGTFAYLDRDGRWHEVWPVAGKPDELLPRAVRLTQRLSGGRGERVWWAEVGAAPGLPPAQRHAVDAANAPF